MKSSGGDLFIVDNSDLGWTGLKYLKQWTEISTNFFILIILHEFVYLKRL